MKTVSKAVMAVLVMMAAAGGAARADDVIFEASAGTTVTAGSQEAPGQAMALGTVTLSSKGEVKILWDGVSLNLGSYTAGQTTSNRNFISANLPTLYLDLQKLFGVHWMDAIRLSLGAGSYDNSPIAGKTDINLGTISVNLTQTVLKTKAVQWTMDESAGMSGYFSRQTYEASQPFEAVPVNFIVNTKLVANISSETVVAISMGAYATICSGINANAGFRALVVGGQLTPSVAFGQHWAIGAHLEGTEMIELADGNGVSTALNVSAFVKYMFTTGQGSLHQSLELNVGAIDDGIVKNIDGDNTRADFAGLKYSIAF